MEKYNLMNKKKLIYILAAIVILLIALSMLPIWNIETIKVSNNHYYTYDEIIKQSGISKGRNIFSISRRETTKRLSELPLIKKVHIKYLFPRQICIDVEEKEPIGYVPFLGTYLCIDANGYVIDETHKKELDLPVIEGFLFQSFTLNSKLEIENDDALLYCVEMIRTLKKYNYAKEIDNIDISNLEQIHLYVDSLDVIIGNMKDFDKKIRWLMTTQGKLSMGILDLSNVNSGQVVLEPLT